MANMLKTIKDPFVLLLRAEFKTANIAVDNAVIELDKHINDVEQARASNEVPKEMLYDFSVRLNTLFDEGDALLAKKSSLVTKLDYLSMTYGRFFPATTFFCCRMYFSLF